MIKRYERMTNKELKEIVADYAAAFPGWSQFKGTAIVRERGPIQQMIWFEALSTGDYRPNHAVNTLALGMVGMLPQMLDVQHRQATLRQHQSKRDGIIVAMEQQFKPSIRKLLDIAEIAELCELEAQERTNDLAMLAILYAWLGRNSESLRCCRRMQACEPPALAPVFKWEEQMKAFGRSLAKAVEAGSAREFLDAAAMEARKE
jgi:hypothetical protein